MCKVYTYCLGNWHYFSDVWPSNITKNCELFSHSCGFLSYTQSDFEIRRDVTRGRLHASLPVTLKCSVVPWFHVLPAWLMVTCLKYAMTSHLISKLDRVYHTYSVMYHTGHWCIYFFFFFNFNLLQFVVEGQIAWFPTIIIKKSKYISHTVVFDLLCIAVNK